MEPIVIGPNDCQRIRAAYVEGKLRPMHVQVRLPGSQRWRRVYLFVGLHGHTIEGKNHFYYVRTKDDPYLEVVLPISDPDMPRPVEGRG